MSTEEHTGPEGDRISPIGQVILHLSDLHFGYDKNLAMKAGRTKVLSELTAALGALEPEWHPTILCITGDIAYYAAAEEYTEAEAWIRTLTDFLAIDTRNILVCPGNHDVIRAELKLFGMPTDEKEADTFLQVLEGPNPIATPWLSPLRNFAEFCARLGLELYAFGSVASYIIGTRQVEGIKFISCNSAWCCAGRGSPGQEDLGLLYMGRPHLEHMEYMGQISRLNNSFDTVTIAIMHHPHDWLHPSERASYGDRRCTFNWLAESSHLILCGHTHGRVDKCSRIVAHAYHGVGGATYFGSDYQNSFRLFRVNPLGFEMKAYEADPGGQAPFWKPVLTEELPVARQAFDQQAVDAIRGATTGRFLDFSASPKESGTVELVAAGNGDEVAQAIGDISLFSAPSMDVHVESEVLAEEVDDRRDQGTLNYDSRRTGKLERGDPIAKRDEEVKVQLQEMAKRIRQLLKRHEFEAAALVADDLSGAIKDHEDVIPPDMIQMVSKIAALAYANAGVAVDNEERNSRIRKIEWLIIGKDHVD